MPQACRRFVNKIAAMYTIVTHDIQITVLPEFVPERSDADEASFWWAYTVEIANRGKVTVQLTARHWKITDGNGRLEEVKGAGVVGEQPILKPGETFRYTSGTNMSTPSGIMTGTYKMVNENGESFDAEIPVFSLDSPYARRVLN
jgi:ApaG protein